MILSKFALWVVVIIKTFAAADIIEDLLNGKSVFIEKGHYLLHNAKLKSAISLKGLNVEVV
jgi:hypothetical protein